MWLQKLMVHEPFLAQPWFMDMVITCMKLTWHDANVTWFTTAGVYLKLFITKIYTTLLLNVLYVR